jgi:hypothetical protein
MKASVIAILLALALAGCGRDTGKLLECMFNPHTPDCQYEEP